MIDGILDGIGDRPVGDGRGGGMLLLLLLPFDFFLDFFLDEGGGVEAYTVEGAVMGDSMNLSRSDSSTVMSSDR